MAADSSDGGRIQHTFADNDIILGRGQDGVMPGRADMVEIAEKLRCLVDEIGMDAGLLRPILEFGNGLGGNRMIVQQRVGNLRGVHLLVLAKRLNAFLAGIARSPIGPGLSSAAGKTLNTGPTPGVRTNIWLQYAAAIAKIWKWEWDEGIAYPPKKSK